MEYTSSEQIMAASMLNFIDESLYKEELFQYLSGKELGQCLTLNLNNVHPTNINCSYGSIFNRLHSNPAGNSF